MQRLGLASQQVLVLVSPRPMKPKSPSINPEVGAIDGSRAVGVGSNKTKRDLRKHGFFLASGLESGL